MKQITTEKDLFSECLKAVDRLTLNCCCFVGIVWHTACFIFLPTSVVC